MSGTESAPPVLPEPVPPPQKTLRKLFLTLFLRGRGARGLNKQGAPKTIGGKLARTLSFYFLFGCLALGFFKQPVFALAVYLHAMTFVFLGMFVAASAGEILFNKEEGDILLHRPVSPKIMLWAKIRVLVEVSLWLAGAFNLVGLFVGFGSGNWLFPLVHIFSTTLEALFCTGCVVLIYQLCLRWFGRERLDSLMTMTQVLVSITAVLAGQILPRIVFRMGHVLNAGQLPWWVNLLPPAWFAGLDDACAGSRTSAAWLLGSMAVVSTSLVLWMAFGKLAQTYETGLQALNETSSVRIKTRNHRRWLDWLVTVPPLRWWLRDPVSRASFLLVSAYLLRDRDVKLRVYPGIAPVLVIPAIFLLQNHQRAGMNDPGFGLPFSGIYVGMVPLIGMQLLQYSQQWQAADVFRVAPLAGPAAISHGARRAVLCLLAAPMLVLVTLVAWLICGSFTGLVLLLPGVIALPVFALVPSLTGNSLPLSMPTDAAKSAGRGSKMIILMVVAFALAGLASSAWAHGWFWWLILGELVVAIGVYSVMRLMLAKVRWPAIE